LRQVRSRLGDLNNRTVAVLGLVYTPNTSTLRRSAAVELCRQLHTSGAHVRAFDPVIMKSEPELGEVSLVRSLEAALEQADAAVVCTEWPQFREAPWNRLVPTMRRALFVDANRFLEKPLQHVAGVEHISVGRS
jgi:UDPglucose 6-dehydrogenase